jgi:hypothetical protein
MIVEVGVTAHCQSPPPRILQLPAGCLHSYHAPALPCISAAESAVSQVLQSEGLLDDQLSAELAKGDMYWANERQLCAAMLAGGGAPGHRHSHGQTTAGLPGRDEHQRVDQPGPSQEGVGDADTAMREGGATAGDSEDTGGQGNTNAGGPLASMPFSSLPSRPSAQQHQITLNKVLQTHSAKSFDYRVSCDTAFLCVVFERHAGHPALHDRECSAEYSTSLASLPCFNRCSTSSCASCQAKPLTHSWWSSCMLMRYIWY